MDYLPYAIALGIAVIGCLVQAIFSDRAKAKELDRLKEEG
jgi:hypothetical protein